MSDENIHDNPDLTPEGQPPRKASSSKEDALRAMMESYYIEYASYCVKDRAIPDVDDGLKPVHRRILHTLEQMDNGMMHMVANVYGSTMKYHPHGDASIEAALVVLANKDYYIDRQGNFGNIVTGDPAAAGRYIECRLSKFASEVLFYPQITRYVPSYDGRNQEPVVLPAKVPSLLMLGADGIAVGMATHIMPHNFCELIQAEIDLLHGKSVQVLPDFQTGGLMDASEYDDGRGRILVRARIEAEGDKKIVIKEVPAYTTTDALMESIEDASRKGKVKIAGIVDLTADQVNIEITLPRNVYAEETIQALYAYTKCQQSVKSMLLVIRDNVPVEMTVSEVLERNVAKLREYLRRELELRLDAINGAIHGKTLERLFIENRIYKAIEKCPSLEKIFQAVRSGLEKFRAELLYDITDDDIGRLLAIPIRRISLYDIDKNLAEIAALQQERTQVEYDLAHQVEYATAFLRRLLEKYGSRFPRRTEIASFAAIDRREIARRDVKVYQDRIGGFIGTAVKPSNKNDAPLLCTEFERLLCLRTDGSCVVIPISGKTFIGQTKYVFIYDPEQVFSIIYHDKKEGTWYAKRFRIGQHILEKEYHVIPENCVIDHLYTNSGVVVSLELEPNRRRSYNAIKVDFDTIEMRSREARGFKLTHYPVVGMTVLCKGSAAAENTPVASPPAAPDAPDAPDAPPSAPDAPAPPPSAEPDATSPPHKSIYPPRQDDLPFFL